MTAGQQDDAMDEATDPLAGLRDGPWLDAFEPEPLRWAVNGLVPEGLSLLAGAPKVGKSWLALDICIAVATGGLALGALPVEQGRVLYLALEDGPRRLKNRIELLSGNKATPSAFTFLTAMPGSLLTVLEAYAARHPHTRLIVIDTLGRVRGQGSPNGDRYQEEYAQMASLHRFALRRGLAVLVVHHTRKAASEDFVDAVSGTHGLAGAADCVLVLRRPRGEADGQLQVTGRDVEERDVFLRRAGPAWQVFDGAPAQARFAPAMAQVIEQVVAHPDGVTPKQVAEATGLLEATVRQYLSRAERTEDVKKVARGIYTPVTSVASVTTGQPLPTRSYTSDSSYRVREGPIAEESTL